MSDVPLGQLHALGLALGNERHGVALARARDDGDLATVRQVGVEAPILAVLLAVLRTHGAAEVRAVDLDLTLKGILGRLSREGLAQLVSKDEGRLVGDVLIAAELERREALHSVHEYRDGRRTGP